MKFSAKIYIPTKENIKHIISVSKAFKINLHMFKNESIDPEITLIIIFIKGMALNNLVILSTLSVLRILKDFNADKPEKAFLNYLPYL